MGSKGNVVLLVTLVTLVIVGLVWFGLGWVGLGWVGWLVGGVVVAVAGNFSNQWWRALVDCYYGSSPKCFSEKRRSED